MADDLDELTGGVRRMWSTARLTSKLGARAAGLNAVLAQLRATGPWRDILDDILAMPIEPAPSLT